VSDDLAVRLRERAAALRAKADRLDAAADEVESDGPRPAKVKRAIARVKKAGKQRLGPTNGARGPTRQRVADYLRQHPKATGAEVGKALGLKGTGVYHHLAVLRKSA